MGVAGAAKLERLSRLVRAIVDRLIGWVSGVKSTGRVNYGRRKKKKSKHANRVVVNETSRREDEEADCQECRRD